MTESDSANDALARFFDSKSREVVDGIAALAAHARKVAVSPFEERSLDLAEHDVVEMDTEQPLDPPARDRPVS